MSDDTTLAHWSRRTLILLKPDALRRHLVGKIIAEFERYGFEPYALRMLLATRKQAEAHYMHHAGEPYHEKLVQFLISGTIIAAVMGSRIVSSASPDAFLKARKIIGPFLNPRVRGTIRGDYMHNDTDDMENLVHGSDSIAEARRESLIWFPDILD